MTALNEIKVNDLKWTGRTLTALRNGGLIEGKTLADLDKIEPDELLSVNRLGRGSLQEISSKIADAKIKMASERSKARETRAASTSTVPNPVPETETNGTNGTSVTSEAPKRQHRQPEATTEAEDDVVLNYANNHRSMIQALMNGEMVLIPRS